jgi:intracellular multiplication protein IcmB
MKVVLDPIMGMFDGLVSFAASRMKLHMRDLCKLEAPRGDHTFVATNGDLITFLKVDGILDALGPDQYAEQIQRFRLMLNSMLGEGRHELQWVFARSPMQTKLLLEAAYGASLKTAERSGLDTSFIESLLGERQRLMLSKVVAETSVLVFTTKLASLSEHDRKAGVKAMNAKRQASGLIGLIGSPFNQDIFIGVDQLTVQHEAALRQLLSELTQKPISLEVAPMDCHDAIRQVRQFMDPSGTASHWRPRLPGDPVSVRAESLDRGNGVDNFAHASLSQQIFRHAPTNDAESGQLVNCAGRWHATAALDVGPETMYPWAALFRAVPLHIEWRYSVSLTGGSQIIKGKLARKESLARLLRATGGNNDLFMRSAEVLQQLVNQEGENLSSVRVAITVSSATREQAMSHLEEALRALQGWGNCDAVPEQGDATEAMVSTLPGMDQGTLGTALVLPNTQVAYFLPSTRMASAWSEGGVVFRTLDGKLYPYQPGSRQQQSWIDLVFGPSGGGKSVLLNTLNMAALLTPGLSEVPKIGIIDIGPSSAGFVDLARDLLPPHLRDLAVSVKLQNDKRFANNPFDTLLGLKYPTPPEKNFLSNFLTLLFTPASAEDPWEMLPELCGILLDECYHYYAEVKPKVYQPGIESVIDKLVSDNPGWAKQDRELTWWEIVENLMNAGSHIEAGRAQRHAVPRLKELSGILQGSKIIRDTYGTYTPPNSSRTLIELAQMMIQNVVNDFPILAYPTVFNPSAARIVSLDLADVAKGSGPQGFKNTALMYLLARQMLVKDLFISEDDCNQFPEPARSYHITKVRKLQSVPKRLNYDELHRTGGVKPVVKQLEQDGREVRKYGIQLSLGTQSHHDFSKIMVDLATNFWVLLAPNKAVQDELRDLLGLSAAAYDALRNDVRGAGPNGASFLLWSRTKRGNFSLPLMNSLGPLELWTLSTTTEDNFVRQATFRSLGRKKGTLALAKLYPTGSIVQLVDDMLARNPDRPKDKALEEIVQAVIDFGSKMTEELAA